jgi:hypothetical protein
MHALDILERMHRRLKYLDRDMRRHRPLDDNAGDARIGIQAMDRRFQFAGGDIGGKPPFLEADTGQCRLGALVAHIDIHRCGVADGD